MSRAVGTAARYEGDCTECGFHCGGTETFVHRKAVVHSQQTDHRVRIGREDEA